MPAPEIEPGVIEQAIYAWSKSDVNGRRGQGFAAISPGLQNSVDWLNVLDLDCFQPLDGSLQGSEAQAYTGWKEQITVGSFQAKKLNLVYRKMPSAGHDDRTRNRFVIHVMIGRRDEFGLGAVSDDDPHWFGPEHCALDNLPELSSLSLSALTPLKREHDCKLVDRQACEILERWSLANGRLKEDWPLSTPTSALTTSLLTLVPTPLWNGIELDWRIGPKGPIAYAAISPGPSATSEPIQSMNATGIGECPLHKESDRTWRGLPAQTRSWQAFVDAFNTPARRSTADTTSSTTHLPKAQSPRAELFANIGKDIGLPGWHGSPALDDSKADLALRAAARLSKPPGGWLASFSPDDLRAIFSGVESNPTFRRATEFLHAAAPSIGSMTDAWRGTGLAVLGVALLEHPGIRRNPAQQWAVPKSINQQQLERLVQYLGRNEPGIERISLLLKNGFSSSPKGRQSIIRALLGADMTPRYIFVEILPRAELSPAELFEFMRENLGAISRWLQLPQPYEEALRHGFEPRRWLPFGRILGPLWKGTSDAEGPPA